MAQSTFTLTKYMLYVNFGTIYFCRGFKNVEIVYWKIDLITFVNDIPFFINDILFSQICCTNQKNWFLSQFLSTLKREFFFKVKNTGCLKKFWLWKSLNCTLFLHFIGIFTKTSLLHLDTTYKKWKMSGQTLWRLYFSWDIQV